MSNKKLLGELARNDAYYLNELKIAKNDVSKLIEITNKRLVLYAKYTGSLDDIYITLVDARKSDIFNELLLHKLKKEFDEKINEIMTRLDEIEEHIHKP